MSWLTSLERTIQRLLDKAARPLDGAAAPRSAARGGSRRRPIEPVDLDHALRDAARSAAMPLLGETYLPDHVTLLLPLSEQEHWERLRDVIVTQGRRTLRDLARHSGHRFLGEFRCELQFEEGLAPGEHRIGLAFSAAGEPPSGGGSAPGPRAEAPLFQAEEHADAKTEIHLAAAERESPPGAVVGLLLARDDRGREHLRHELRAGSLVALVTDVSGVEVRPMPQPGALVVIEVRVDGSTLRATGGDVDVRVNGRPVQRETVLREMDTIRIGGFLLIHRLPASTS